MKPPPGDVRSLAQSMREVSVATVFTAGEKVNIAGNQLEVAATLQKVEEVVTGAIEKLSTTQLRGTFIEAVLKDDNSVRMYTGIN